MGNGPSRRVGDRARQWRGQVAEAAAAVMRTVPDRLRRLRVTSLLIIQSGLASSVAWEISDYFLPKRQAVFAAVTALVTIAVSVTQRIRRVLELVVGVAIGLLLADLLVLALGNGGWQVGVVVVIAMSIAVLAGGGPVLIVQAAATAILIATVIPPRNFYFGRIYDALIGGGVALVVSLVLLPLNPITVARHTAGPAMDSLSQTLAEAARALETGGFDVARAANDRGVEAGDRMRVFVEALRSGGEVSRFAPARWRTRGYLERYVVAAAQGEHLSRNIGVLIRRVVAVLSRGEPVPEELPAILRMLADAVRTLSEELAHGREPQEARAELVEAVQVTVPGLASATTLSTQVLVGQTRSIAVDLLQATGLSRTAADRAARRALRVAHPRQSERPGDAEPR